MIGLALLLLRAALAAPPTPIAPVRSTDPAQLVAELTGDVAKERVFAARELRRQARRAVAELGSRDELVSAEARLLLEELDGNAAPACTSALSDRQLSGLCADVLRALETTDALPALRAAQPTASGANARKITRAITFLESL